MKSRYLALVPLILLALFLIPLVLLRNEDRLLPLALERPAEKQQLRTSIT